MTPKAERDACELCGRPKAQGREEWNRAISESYDHAAVCGRYDRDYEGEATQECQALQIARLKSELATERECRLANEAELRRADERIGRLRATLEHFIEVQQAFGGEPSVLEDDCQQALATDDALSNPNAEGKP